MNEQRVYVKFWCSNQCFIHGVQLRKASWSCSDDLQDFIENSSWVMSLGVTVTEAAVGSGQGWAQRYDVNLGAEEAALSSFVLL